MTTHDEDQPRVAFTVHNLTAGTVNQVGRDQFIAHQDTQASFAIINAQQEMRVLREAFGVVPLPPADRRAANDALDEVETELSKEVPDKEKVAGRLEGFTRVLLNTGALLKAGASLIQPLQQLARWLGPLGIPLLGLLAPLI